MGSRLYRAIQGLAKPGDRAQLATVTGNLGGGRYTVSAGGQSGEVPAVGGADARAGQQVAIIVSGETGRPVALLGTVSAGAAE